MYLECTNCRESLAQCRCHRFEECQKKGHGLECDCHITDHIWISVKDRMPETDTELLFVSQGRIRFGEYVWYDPDYRWDDLVATLYREDVTHWMPLPSPPEE